MNLDPTRDVADLRTLSAALDAAIILSVHRYPKGSFFYGQRQWQPWFGNTRDEETARVLEMAAPHRVAYTEFGYHRAPTKLGLGWRTETLTYADCYADIVADLQLLDRMGIERAVLFQWTDGPDPNQPDHMYGICGVDGTLHPHAAALTDWRANGSV